MFDNGLRPFCEIFPFGALEGCPPRDAGPYKTLECMPYPLPFEFAVLPKLSIEEFGGGRRDVTSLFVFKRKL